MQNLKPNLWFPVPYKRALTLFLLVNLLERWGRERQMYSEWQEERRVPGSHRLGGDMGVECGGTSRQGRKIRGV